MTMTQPRPPVTRFAPSPTGFLHIGGVRTAIFNWLYAKARGGSFLLRIEDTDKARCTPEASDAIVQGLAWMGLDPDCEPTLQSSRADRHVEIAQQLLACGQAYRCYCSPEELEAMRARASAQGLPRAYDGTWRDRDPEEAPAGVSPVIRFRAVQDGSSTLDDLVQGPVTRPNENADDLILLRADGSATYNLSVVVDDHDMGVTHVIRGDDHLNNAFRQKQIYEALGWPLPRFAHIPLIHGHDGAKLSKRHGALGVEAYAAEGYSAEGLFSYLLKLGWSHGDEDLVTRDRALEIFDLSGIGKSPSRLDLDKLKSVNKALQDALAPAALMQAALAFSGADPSEEVLSQEVVARLLRAAPALQARSATLADMVRQFAFFEAEPPLALDAKAQSALDADGQAMLRALLPVLEAQGDWQIDSLLAVLKAFASDQGVKVGKVFMPLRAALTGTMASPGVAEMAYAFGKDKTLRHLRHAIGRL